MAGRPKKAVTDHNDEQVPGYDPEPVIEDIVADEEKKVLPANDETKTTVNPCSGCKYAERASVCKSCIEYKG